MLLTPEVTSIFQALSDDFYLIISLLLFFLCRPGQRTVDDLEIIYEELLHIKALSHLSTTVSCLLAEAEGRGAQFELNALFGLKESIGECGRGAGTPEFSLTNGPSCFSRDAKEAMRVCNHQRRIDPQLPLFILLASELRGETWLAVMLIYLLIKNIIDYMSL